MDKVIIKFTKLYSIQYVRLKIIFLEFFIDFFVFYF